MVFPPPPPGFTGPPPIFGMPTFGSGAAAAPSDLIIPPSFGTEAPPVASRFSPTPPPSPTPAADFLRRAAIASRRASPPPHFGTVFTAPGFYPPGIPGPFARALAGSPVGEGDVDMADRAPAAASADSVRDLLTSNPERKRKFVVSLVPYDPETAQEPSPDGMSVDGVQAAAGAFFTDPDRAKRARK
jgi:hypothetical protein